MVLGLQDAKSRWQKLEWRRIADYGPVNVEVDLSNESGGAPRRDFSAERAEFLRVLLRHEPTHGEPNEVTLYTASGRRIGSLCPDIAAWIAPLLESGNTAFEGDLWPREAGRSQGERPADCWTMTLIQYELSPAAQSPWSTSLKTAFGGGG